MENISQKEVRKIMLDFPFTPTRNKVIITVNATEVAGFDLTGEEFDMYQYVVAVSQTTTGIVTPGSKVLLDLERMTTKVEGDNGELITKIALKPIEVDGRVYAIINDTVINAVCN